jgi:uncharacterized protein YjiS (DUF1127 family)
MEVENMSLQEEGRGQCSSEGDEPQSVVVDFYSLLTLAYGLPQAEGRLRSEVGEVGGADVDAETLAQRLGGLAESLKRVSRQRRNLAELAEQSDEKLAELGLTPRTTEELLDNLDQLGIEPSQYPFIGDVLRRYRLSEPSTRGEARRPGETPDVAVTKAMLNSPHHYYAEVILKYAAGEVEGYAEAVARVNAEQNWPEGVSLETMKNRFYASKANTLKRIGIIGERLMEQGIIELPLSTMQLEAIPFEEDRAFVKAVGKVYAGESAAEVLTAIAAGQVRLPESKKKE